MSASKKKPGRRVIRMTVGEAVRCAAMDCEATVPSAAMIVWLDANGRVHKRVFPNNQVVEDGLFSALDRLPPGPTPEGAGRA